MSLTIALGGDGMPGRGRGQDHAAIVERITAASRMFEYGSQGDLREA